MNIFQHICVGLLILCFLYLIQHTHDDITAIQDNLGMLDQGGRLLPEWRTDKFKESKP